MTVTVRPATEADYEPFTKLDFTYTVGDSYLELERTGDEPEFTYSMRWRTGTPSERVYSQYTVDDLRRLQKENDAFLVAEADGALAASRSLSPQRPSGSRAAHRTSFVRVREESLAGAGDSGVAAGGVVPVVRSGSG